MEAPNLYDLVVEFNVLAEKWNAQLYEVFKAIDNKETDAAIEYEIEKLDNLYKNIEINEGINGVFKHYAMNLTALTRTYKGGPDVKLSDLNSEQLIYMSSRLDEWLAEQKASKK